MDSCGNLLLLDQILLQNIGIKGDSEGLEYILKEN